MARKHRNKKIVCPNCDADLLKAFEFCPHCGQENHDLRVPFRTFLYEFVESITHFDTKLWNSLKVIFTEPGLLTKDFVEGRRARYVNPARFYVFVSFVFFALLTLWVDRGIQVDHNDPTKRIVTSRLNKILPDSAMALLSADSVLTNLIELPIDSPWYGRARTRLVAGELWFLDSIAQHSGVDTIAGISDRLRQAMRSMPDSSSLDVERHVPLWGTNNVTFPNRAEQQAFLRIGANMTDLQADSIMGMGSGEPPTWFEKRMVRSIGRLQVGSIQGTQRLAHLVVKNISIVMFLLMPFTAVLLLWIFYRKRYYWEHLIFSVHIHTIFFLFFSALLILALAIPGAWYSWVMGLIVLACLSYLLISLKRVYGKPWVPTVLRLALMSIPYFITFLLLLAVGFFWGLIAL